MAADAHSIDPTAYLDGVAFCVQKFPHPDSVLEAMEALGGLAR